MLIITVKFTKIKTVKLYNEFLISVNYNSKVYRKKKLSSYIVNFS